MFLEFKKIKRTGLFAAAFFSGAAAAALPVLESFFREEKYISESNILSLIFQSNWQMMATVNILFLLTGACILYNTENSDGAIRKMKTLPLSQSSMFFGKFAVTVFFLIIMLVLEASGIVFCLHRFSDLSADSVSELVRTFLFLAIISLPSAVLSLMVSSAFENMWVSLGTGVVLVFISTLITKNSPAMYVFPFSLSFNAPFGMTADCVQRLLGVSCVITALLFAFEILFLKIRRCAE